MLMVTLHYPFWPKISKSLKVPSTSLYDNLKVSANRYPDQDACFYYGNRITYKQLDAEVNALAGYLEHKLGVQTGKKVLLFMQNSPQFVIGYYAILRANAVVVPINPMLIADELEFYVRDCQIKTAIAGQELYERIHPLVGKTLLENLVIAAYSDYAGDAFEGMLPQEVAAPRFPFTEDGHYLWNEAIQARLTPTEHTAKG